MGRQLTSPPARLAAVARRGAVRYLTPEQMVALVRACAHGPHGARNALLARLLYTTGMRISEALALTPSALRPTPDGWEAYVKGKGGKARVVALPASLARDILAYCYQHQVGQDARIFPFSRSWAFRILLSAGVRAGLGIRVHPHLLRHSHAIHLIQETGNPRVLQLHLGHNSAAYTMRYLQTFWGAEALKKVWAVRFATEADTSPMSEAQKGLPGPRKEGGDIF